MKTDNGERGGAFVSLLMMALLYEVIMKKLVRGHEMILNML